MAEREDGRSPNSGGQPERVGECTACGRVYPLQVDGGDLRPIGTDGDCVCGNDTFDALAD
ncbi:MAG: hypothetical protein ABEJ80_02860 [Halarchaeum sp.]